MGTDVAQALNRILEVLCGQEGEPFRGWRVGQWRGGYWWVGDGAAGCVPSAAEVYPYPVNQDARASALQHRSAPGQPTLSVSVPAMLTTGSHHRPVCHAHSEEINGYKSVRNTDRIATKCGRLRGRTSWWAAERGSKPSVWLQRPRLFVTTIFGCLSKQGRQF